MLWLLTWARAGRRRADGQGPRIARVSARDRAHSAAGQDALSAEPRPPVANRRKAPASHPGALSLVTFSGQAEKVTRPPGWRAEQHTDVSRLSRQRRQSKEKTMDPSFRWDDEEEVAWRLPFSSTATHPIWVLPGSPGYGDKLQRVIDAADPGAVPGGSTQARRERVSAGPN